MKAFPNIETAKDIYGVPQILHRHTGMDLRDYFAAKAMNGYLSRMASNPIAKGPICTDMETETNAEAIAKSAYIFADAMMKVREE